MFKGAAPVTGQFLEGALVQIDQQQGYCPVELSQAEETPVAQSGQNPALYDQHGVLHLGLIPGVAWSCCQQGAAVVGGEFVVQAVGLWVVALGVLDQGAGLVGHDQSRHTTEELQRLNLGTDPVDRGLARGGTGVGVVRRSKGGHEDLCSGDLAAGGINNRHSLTGVVDEQLLTGNMGLAHGTLQAHRPLSVLDAKAGVLVGQKVVFGVFLPQQLQGEAARVNRDSTLTILGPGSFTFTTMVGIACPATGCCAIEIVQGPIFDLALNKSLAPGQSASVFPGALVKYRLTVTNQGNVPATEIALSVSQSGAPFYCWWSNQRK